MQSEPFLDCHVHFWDPRNTPRAVSALVRMLGFCPPLVDAVARVAFPGNVLKFFHSSRHITRPYLPPDYLRDFSGRNLAGVIHMEASWEGKDPLDAVEETRWIQSQSERNGNCIKAIVARADLSRGTDVREVLKAHLEASYLVRGVRDILAWHPESSIMDSCPEEGRSSQEAWREGFSCLAEFGLHFDATCYSHQLPELARLAGDFPDQPIVVSHIGTPVAMAGPYGSEGESEIDRKRIRDDWESPLQELARIPNVSIKLSGFGMPVLGFGFENRNQPPSVEELADLFRPILDTIIDAFGAERCMFGSNFPVDKVSMPLTTLVDAYAKAVETRTPEERARLFHGTAEEVYRIGP